VSRWVNPLICPSTEVRLLAHNQACNLPLCLWQLSKALSIEAYLGPTFPIQKAVLTVQLPYKTF
jgi:hypothetical protein